MVALLDTPMYVHDAIKLCIQQDMILEKLNVFLRKVVEELAKPEESIVATVLNSSL